MKVHHDFTLVETEAGLMDSLLNQVHKNHEEAQAEIDRIRALYTLPKPVIFHMDELWWCGRRRVADRLWIWGCVSGCTPYDAFYRWSCLQ
jgi:hypothetical protein